MVTLTSPSNSMQSAETSSSENDHHHLRDASFSSYLNREKAFFRKVADSSQNPVTRTQDDLLYLGRTKEEDGEIGIFGAEKYFKGGMDESPKMKKIDAKIYQCKKDIVNEVPVKPKIQAGTPSVKSESSWNSHNALLQRILRNPSQRRRNKVPGKSFLSRFNCKCSCSDKESVDIYDYAGELSFNRNASCGTAKITEPVFKELHPDSRMKEEVHSQKLDQLGVGSNRDLCFSFPASNSGPGNLEVKTKILDLVDEKARKSIEVFGSSVVDKRSKSALNIERRLTMLSWDATPRMEEIEFSTTPGGICIDDTESDASSDLFEIESLTGRAIPFLARQTSDATSGCVTPTTCYAPSEASIDWSVITASAADFSVISDFEERRPSIGITSPIKTIITTNAKTTPSKEMQRRHPSILLGCKSYKAVRVAGDAYIRNDNVHSFSKPGMRLRSDSLTTVTRFQTENKLTGYGTGGGKHALVSTRSFPSSHSPRTSHLLYIQ